MYPSDVKKLVRRLRKKGISIIELGKQFGIAKSTISVWVKDIELPPEMRKYLLNKSVTGAIKGAQVIKAKREIEQLKNDDESRTMLRRFDLHNKMLCKLIAAIIFWCEGSKRSLSAMTFTNSDPALIKLFLSCLRTGFEIEERKLRGLVHLHEYHDKTIQTEFWSKTSGIPINQFIKPFFKKNTKIRKRENYQGCLSIRYYDARIARKLDAIYHTLAKIIGP